MPRFRGVPSAVHDSPEWAKASALARMVHRSLRPSAGELVLVRARDDEPLWEQFQRKAAECGAHFSVDECGTIVSECVEAELWEVQDGQLVIAAFPASFEAARAEKSLGPQGGMPAREKMRRMRERRRAERDSRPPQAPSPGDGSPAVTGNNQGGVTGNASEKSPPLSSLSVSGNPSQGIPEREREEEQIHAREASPSVTPAEISLRSAEALGAMRDYELGELVIAWLSDRLGAHFNAIAMADKVDALGRCTKRLAAGCGLSEETIAVIAAFGAADPKAFREVFTWASAVRRGKEPVSVGLLIGGKNADGSHKGTGLEALVAPATKWVAPLVASGKPISVRRPGPVRTGTKQHGIQVRPSRGSGG